MQTLMTHSNITRSLFSYKIPRESQKQRIIEGLHEIGRAMLAL